MQSWMLLVLSIVAFALASLAVQSWRELLILVVLSAGLTVPVKWVSAGTSFGADSVSFGSEPWRGFIRAVSAPLASTILAAPLTRSKFSFSFFRCDVLYIISHI